MLWLWWSSFSLHIVMFSLYKDLVRRSQLSISDFSFCFTRAGEHTGLVAGLCS
uniref:Uncharacterized protein n=1 Tax=Anguilla anguilla TaxID=7936 RepID=A0A0E9XV58_ANGAN